MQDRGAPPRSTLNTPMIERRRSFYPSLKGEPTNHCNAFSRGLSRSLSRRFSSRPPPPPPPKLVVKNSLDAVCVASSRMSAPWWATAWGKAALRRPEGDKWSSGRVPRCLSPAPRLTNGITQHARSHKETRPRFGEQPQTARPSSPTTGRTCRRFWWASFYWGKLRYHEKKWKRQKRILKYNKKLWKTLISVHWVNKTGV